MDPAAVTLGDLLAARRRAMFCGRAAELELVRSAVEAPDLPFSVLHVHGPGGIGKTSLLEAYEVLLRERDWAVLRIDGHQVWQSQEAVRRRFDAFVQLHGARRTALLVDAYESLGSLDGWFRTELVPSLPARGLVVLAGRDAPTSDWRQDVAWGDRLRVISLRNLGPQDALELLRRSGVEPARRARMLELTHGHPMALALIADVGRQGGELSDDQLAPDLVTLLVQRFVDVVPDRLHRRALGACAVARVTTEPLLRDAIGVADAHDLFTWLRSLAFLGEDAEGLFPHELARDVLDLDLRWRDREGYAGVLRGVRTHLEGDLVSGSAHNRQRAIFDLKFCFRNLSGVLSPVDWQSWGRYYPEPARADDADALVDIVAGVLGAESGRVARYWWEHQPEGFHVIRRGDGTPRGVVATIDVTRASDQDRDEDPGALAAWQAAHRIAPPRPGEIVTMTRFVVDADAGLGPSPTMNAAPVLTLAAYLQTPQLAWDFLVMLEPDQWDDYFAVADLPRVPGADFEVDGLTHGLFGHDFRERPVSAWLDLIVERALDDDVEAPRKTPGETMVVLSHEEFTLAVRQALKDLRRPDLLARNPLVRSRVLGDHATSDDASAALGVLVHAACQSLAEHPRDESMLRAVDRTYVHPMRTQEAAAAALELPFSTYRRHLTRGVERVVDWLWDREIYGPDQK